MKWSNGTVVLVGGKYKKTFSTREGRQEGNINLPSTTVCVALATAFATGATVAVYAAVVVCWNDEYRGGAALVFVIRDAEVAPSDYQQCLEGSALVAKMWNRRKDGKEKQKTGGVEGSKWA